MKQGPPDEGPDDTSSRVVRSPSDSTIPAEDRSLLLVDDDKPFLTRLTRAMEARGFVVRTAESVAEGLAADSARGAGVRRDRHAPFRRQRARRDVRAQGEAARRTRHHPHRLREYRDRRHRGEARRVRLSRQARRCRRNLRRLDGDPTTTRRKCRKIPCRPTASAGSISNGSMNCAVATCRRRPAASTCTGAPCREFWPSARRSDAPAQRNRGIISGSLRLCRRSAAVWAKRISSARRVAGAMRWAGPSRMIKAS